MSNSKDWRMTELEQTMGGDHKRTTSRHSRQFSSSLFMSANPKNASNMFSSEIARDTIITNRADEVFHYEIENFSVSTDVKFLYDIGKI